MLKARKAAPVPSSSHTAAAAVRGGEDIMLSCPESFAGTATLQAVHLAFETGPFATYDVAVWASGRPSRVVLSSAAGRISSVTDGEGKVVEREAGCAAGPGPVAHDGGRLFCATATFVGLDGDDLIKRC